MNAKALAVPASLAAVGLGYWYFLRPRHLRWGATDEEVRQPFPGDELIPQAGPAATHAITIDAPAEEVWPWLAQIGQHRAGFYSYAWLENLLGCHMRNADRILPEWQEIHAGDPVWLHPDASPMTVAVLVPGRALVLAATTLPGAGPAPGTVFATWGFYLEPRDDHRCRLIARARSDPGYGVLGGPRRALDSLSNACFWEPAHFVMERKMLREIKRLAEAGARQGEVAPTAVPEQVGTR